MKTGSAKQAQIPTFWIRLARFLANILRYAFHDFISGRLRGTCLLALGNLLPDLLLFSVIRAQIWRLAGVKIADYSTAVIRSGSFVDYPGNLVLGSRCQINRNSYIAANATVFIGDDVAISCNCTILTVSHSGFRHQTDVLNPVVIKDFCLIYANCTILPGSVLEEGVVLAAGSVHKGPTEPWSLYAGVPAKRIKSRQLESGILSLMGPQSNSDRLDDDL